MDVNEAQREQWNGTESDHWVLHADRYDAQLVPFADALFEQLDLSDRDAVLDIGCGCGVTTLTASRQAARAVGADLSEPMLEVARARWAKPASRMQSSWLPTRRHMTSVGRSSPR